MKLYLSENHDPLSCSSETQLKDILYLFISKNISKNKQIKGDSFIVWKGAV